MNRSGIVLALLVLVLGGCATVPQGSALLLGDSSLRRCTDIFVQLDQAVSLAGAKDSQVAAIKDFPYLRTDRFLAAYGQSALTEAALAEWLERMRSLDAEAQQIEFTNLPERDKTVLLKQWSPAQNLEKTINDCGRSLVENDRTQPERLSLLRSRALVPDEYHTSWRVLGLYPMTSLLVASGVRRLHEATRATFAMPLEQLPMNGQLVRYLPPAQAAPSIPELAVLLQQARRSALGIPDIDEALWMKLVAAYAPIWEVDTVTAADRIGEAALDHAATSRIDTGSPVVYTHRSYTRFQDEVLVQLNYTVWFPERTRTGAFDIFGGHLDGLTWRVTLDKSGQPLLYDIMHNCGCYYMAFPGPRLHLRPEALGLREPPLVPDVAPPLMTGQRMVIRLEHLTHFVQRIYPAAVASGETYALKDYNALRSLYLPDGTRRSLFGEDGIVAGTQRRERWLIWPMGIPGPGAMRQHGHHPIAFVGRRHFDDADLLDRLFYLEEP